MKRVPMTGWLFLVLLLSALFCGAAAAQDTGGSSSFAETKCQQAIERSGQTFADQALETVERCTDVVFQCLQKGSESACLNAAQQRCQRLWNDFRLRADGPWAGFSERVLADCSQVPLERMFSAQGLNHSHLPCAGFQPSGVEPANLSDLAACIRSQHWCRAQQTALAALPRAKELIEAGGLPLAEFSCLEGGANGSGQGFGGGSDRRVKADNQRRAGSHSAAQAASETLPILGCQEEIAGAGTTFVKDYQKLLHTCLNAAYECQANRPNDPACLDSAREVCAVQIEKLRAGSRSQVEFFQQGIVRNCGGADGLDRLLLPRGLGYQALEGSCAALNIPALDSVQSVARCIVVQHECRAQQLIVRQIPRTQELLEAVGADPKDFLCLAGDLGAVCGNGIKDTFEECDPPGTADGCAAGSLCSTQCRCVASHPPVLTVEPLTATINAGGSVTLNVSATDPDGDPLTISGTPLLNGAVFSPTTGPNPTGQFSFVAGPGLEGPFTVSFTARDINGLTDHKTAVINVQHVNRAPGLLVPEAATVDEGGVLTLAIRGTDPDGDVLTYTAAPDPLPRNMTFIPATGSLSFTPDFEQAGDYTVTFTVSDGQLMAGPKSCVISVRDVPTGGTGQPAELQLEVNKPQSPTLLATARITGTVNPIPGSTPNPAKATSALITGLSPAQAEQGAALDVILTGQSSGDFVTHFIDGVSAANFGPEITVLGTKATSPTSAIVSIQIAADATPGARPISLVTNTETALSVLAFNVVAGRAKVTGRVVDADSGAGLSEARVSVQGTALVVLTDATGQFLLNNVPPGQRWLTINAVDHEVVTAPVEVRLGLTADIGTIKTKTTVYNPTAPTTTTVFSVLGRGVSDLTGKLDLESARQLVIDTLIAAGGDEAGVLDAYDNQLNPSLQGAGLMSMTDNGVGVYAERLAGGETISILDLFYQMSFSVKWDGAPPKVTEWIAGLQKIVNRAWQKPNDPASKIPILLFNQGNRLNPNPPVISGAMRVNKFQGYLALNSFMAAVMKNRPLKSLRGLGASRAADKDDSTHSYTATWEELLKTLPTDPTGPAPTKVEGNQVLPGFEDLVAAYYMDQSPEALEKMRDILTTQFPDLGLEKIFEENPYDIRRALDKLIEISASDLAVRQQLQIVSSYGNPSGDVNLWTTTSLTKGSAYDSYWGSEYFGLETWWPKVIQRSLAPSPPVIKWAVEKTTLIGPPGGEAAVPGVEVVFYPSSPSIGTSDMTQFVYRLWRADYTEHTDADGTSHNQQRPQGSLTLVATGVVDDPSFLAPKRHADFPGYYYFKVILPPAGMNHYRIDVVQSSPLLALSDLNNPEYARLFKPWLAGYVDEPVAMDPFGGIEGRQVHPGQGWLHQQFFAISALSRPAAVYVGGQGQGLAKFGRIDLAADYRDDRKIYLSIPGFLNSDTDPGSGIILRYDGTTAAITEHTRDMFKRPGQIGMALDDNGNLYTDNAASDAAYGGRVFRYLGWRAGDDAPFNPAVTKTKDVFKMFSGSVNYYSMLIQRANPVEVYQMVMGPPRTAGNGPELLVADGASTSIKAIPIHLSELKEGIDTFHVVGQIWADNSEKPADTVTPLAFDYQTDLCFDREKKKLFITQGSIVNSTTGGRDKGESITKGDAFFASASGCAVCAGLGEQLLFVSDSAAGRIYRIPLADLPLDVPSDAALKKALQDKYIFLQNADRPGQIRITKGGQAFVYVDRTGFRYMGFGFTGQALDKDNNPLVGATVTVNTKKGTFTRTTDANGIYQFTEFVEEPVVYAWINHPKASYSQRIAMRGLCNAQLRAAPCVLINAPASETRTTAEKITVRGSIYPLDVDFANQPGSILSVSSPSGGTTYPLVFTGHHNDFEVPNVELAPGQNTLTVFTPALGQYNASGSLLTYVERVSETPVSQATAGTILDDAGSPRPGVTVKILVDGVERAEVQADGCGFYQKSDLPLGVVTTEVVDLAKRAKSGR